MPLRFNRLTPSFSFLDILHTAGVYLLSAAAFAQTDSSHFVTVVNVPPDSLGYRPTILSDTQVNVFDGGFIPDDTNIGTVDGLSENIEVNIFDGKIGDEVYVFAGGTVNILGGSVDSRLYAVDRGRVDIYGGLIGESTSGLKALSGSHVFLGGGTFAPGFESLPGSNLVIAGGEFQLNGTPYTQTDLPPLTAADVFTGTLADDSPFIFSPQVYDALAGAALDVTPLPVASPALVVVDSNTTDVPAGLRSGQSLTLKDGGLLETHFAAVDASMIIEGGTVTNTLEVYSGSVEMTGGTVSARFHAFDNSVITINGGTLSGWNAALSGSTFNISDGRINGQFRASQGSTVNIVGRFIEADFTAQSGSIVNIDGGLLWPGFTAESGSQINIAGGDIGSGFNAQSGSEVHISGGQIGGSFHGDMGSQVTITGGHVGGGFSGDHVQIGGGVFGRGFRGGANTELVGGEFRLNGVPYAGATVTIGANDDVFTGTLADGSPFIFSDRDLLYDSLTEVRLTTVVLPEFSATPTVVDGDSLNLPTGVRTGQSIVAEQGAVLTDDFSVVGGSLTIDGGSVGTNMNVAGGTVTLLQGDIAGGAIALDSSLLQISGGTIDQLRSFNSEVVVDGGEVRGIWYALDDSVVTLRGGASSRELHARESVVTVEGGNHADIVAADSSSVFLRGGVVGGFGLHTGSTSEISGGYIGSLDVSQDGVAMVSGGVISDLSAPAGTLQMSGGSITGITTASGGGVEISGGEFMLNGAVYTDPTVSLAGGDVLTGTFADGSAFVFAEARDDTLDQVKLINQAPPIADLTPVVIDASTDVVPYGLRAGQTLTVSEDGELPNGFKAVGSSLLVDGGTAGDDVTVVGGSVHLSGGSIGQEMSLFEGATLHTQGGEVGQALRIYTGSSATIDSGRIAQIPYIYDGGELRVNGGVVENTLRVYSGGVLTVTGGSVGDDATVYGGGRVEVSGGTLGRDYRVFSGAVVNLTGGSTGSSWEASRDSEVNLAGGHLGSYFEAKSGSTFNITGGTIGRGLRARAGSNVDINGGEFRLNGVPFTDDTINLTSGTDVLTGTLADGSVVILSPRRSDLLTDITLVRTALTAIDTTPFFVDGSGGSMPRGLRSGQSLTIGHGAELIEQFSAVDGRLVIAGGVVNTAVELYNTDMEVTTGEVRGTIDAFAGSTVTISDSLDLELDLSAHPQSVVNVNGGEGSRLVIDAGEGSTVNLRGGRIESSFAFPGSESGPVVRAANGSTVNLFGSDFSIDGTPIEGLELGVAQTLTDLAGTELTGRFEDGHAFTLDFGNGFPFSFNRSTIDPDAIFTATLIEAMVAGDYNGNGEVDAADYTVWADSFGSTTLLAADGNGNGVIDAADYTLWADNFGSTSVANLGLTNIPEPGTLALIGLIVPTFMRRRLTRP